MIFTADPQLQAEEVEQADEYEQQRSPGSGEPPAGSEGPPEGQAGQVDECVCAPTRTDQMFLHQDVKL